MQRSAKHSVRQQGPGQRTLEESNEINCDVFGRNRDGTRPAPEFGCQCALAGRSKEKMAAACEAKSKEQNWK